MKRLPFAVARLLEREEPDRRVGPFFLVEQIGRGSFAPVWLARERYGALELRVAAVKLFSLEAMAEGAPSAARDRIVEEARALCRVEHPHVVRFYALSIDEDAGVMGLAMEHLGGTTLEQRITADGRLEIGEVIRIGIAVSSALAAIHRAGLVHRDIKLANILEAAGVPKIIDFGIAAADAAPRQPATEPPADAREVDGQATERLCGRAAGTPGYIDPVCARTGAPACVASDLYALGVTLFACLTGRVPAAIEGTRSLDRAVVEGRAPSPDVRARRREVPDALADLVGAMLSAERDRRPGSADEVKARLERIQRGLSASPRPLPPEEIGPFRGLGRFEERDRDLFFGRSREIAAALEGLRGRGLVALVGPSGSGKSSLARAGLLPAIADGALGGWPPRWDTAVVEPGRDPRAAICAALERLVPGASATSPEALIDALAVRAAAEGRGLTLLVDPLEELATISTGEARSYAASLLRRIGARPIPGVRAVVAARRDLLDPLLAIDGLGETLARGIVLVEPLPAAALREILGEALAAYGYAFEDEALGEEVSAGIDATEGAMPLVEFALAELWKQRDVAGRRLVREGLAAIGGVAGALERHAEATLGSLEAALPDAMEAARATLLALTTPEGTRAARGWEEILAVAGSAAAVVLDAFTRARLVVPAPGGVTLAHEALIAQWSRLSAWVAEAREDRRLAEEIERDAKRRRAEPEAVPLWRGRRLVFARELAGRRTVRLSGDAAAFLRASRAAERRVRLGAAFVSGAIALSLGGWGLAYVRAARAERAAAEQALLQEREGKRLTDEKRQALAEAALRIDGLLEQLKDTKTREDGEARLQEIHGLLGVAPRRSTHPSTAPPKPVVLPALSVAAPPQSAPPAAVPFEPLGEWR